MQMWTKKLLLILLLCSVCQAALVGTDFSEYTTGQPLSDWTERWKTANVSNIVNAGTWGYKIGKELYIDNNASQRTLLSWDDLDGTTDSDIIVLMKNSQMDAHGFGIVCRGSGAATHEEGYVLSFVEDYLGQGTIYYSKYLDGTPTTTYIRCFVTNSAYYWIRFQCIGTSLKAKVWSYDEIEPEDWVLDETDEDISAAGWVGIRVFPVCDNYCYYFACDASGTTATIPAAYTGSNAFGMLWPNKETTGTVVSTSIIGGLMPSGQFWSLTGAEIYCGGTHTAQIRVAVYSGGSLATGPEGATLLYDFGETTGSATNSWIALACDAVSIPANTPLWVSTKGNDSGFSITESYSGSLGSAGNFQKARGRFISDTVSTDETEAYPATWPSDGGTFASDWSEFKILLTAREADVAGGGQLIMIQEF